MGMVLEDIRKKLLEKLCVASQKHTDAAQADHEIAELFTTLSNDEIATMVRRINIELYQIREQVRELEREAPELRRQLTAIQAHCKHPDEKVDSEGSIEIRICKLCGHSRTLNYSTSHLYERF